MSMINENINDMYRLMERHMRFGALDTEPRGVFTQILRDVAEGEEPLVPQTATGWQLFTDMEQVDDVATELHNKVQEVVDIANDNRSEFRQAFVRHFGEP